MNDPGSFVLCYPARTGTNFLIRWLHAQPVDFWHFLGFARTPLKSGALRNLLLVLDPAAFEDALTAWLGVALPTEALSPIALDGKSLRGTGGIDERAQRLVAAYEHQTGIVLKQLVVPKDTNEQKAALVLLKQWVLTGRVITADALYCQQETCQLITDSGGDYVIPVKDNQPTLLKAIEVELAAQDAALPTAAT